MVAGAVTVNVGSGWSLCFQKSFREFWLEPGRRGSFSRIMRPDIVMGRGQAEEPGRLIVLDAKYRVGDRLASALDSIHTYRDALVEEHETGRVRGIVAGAYVITPHLAELENDVEYRGTTMPGRLFHPEYRRSFRFGAVTLRPGGRGSELAGVLRKIVADAMA